MKLFFTILLVVTISLECFADNTVTGTVVQASDQSPIAGANVLLKDANGKLLAYGVSDANGRFSIMLPSTSENLTINATKIGYRLYSAPLVSDNKPIIIRMEKGAFQLADELQLPIVPLTIDGSFEVLPRTGGFIRRHRMILTMHDPIYPQGQGPEDIKITMEKAYSAVQSRLPECYKD